GVQTCALPISSHARLCDEAYTGREYMVDYTEKSRFSNRLYISILDGRTIEDCRSICKIGVRSEPRRRSVAQSAFAKLSPRCNGGYRFGIVVKQYRVQLANHHI